MKFDFINRRVLFIVIGVFFFGGYFCGADDSLNTSKSLGLDELKEIEEEREEDSIKSEADITKEEETIVDGEDEDVEEEDEKSQDQNELLETKSEKKDEKEKEGNSTEDKGAVFEGDEESLSEESNAEELEDRKIQQDSKTDSAKEAVLVKERKVEVKEKEESIDLEIAEIEKVVINEIVIGDDFSTKNDFIELYNYSSKEIDLDGFSLKKKTSGGSKSNLVSSSKFKGKIGPGKFFVIKNVNYNREILSDTSFSGKSYSIAKNNRVYLHNREGVLVDFIGWGVCGEKCESDLFPFDLVEGVSLSRKKIDKDVEHKKLFELTGFTTPGEKNVFSSEIVYPEKIGFSEILSNPEGVDKGSEMVELKSGEDSLISLSGWSLENGAGKRFTLKNFSIKAQGFLVIKIENSSFVIRNSKEKLSLINPAGKIVDVVEMTFSAPSGISWGIDSKGEWSWNREKTFGADNKINRLPKIKIKTDKKVYRNIYAEFNASSSYDKDGDALKFVWDFDDGHRSYLAKTKHLFKKKGVYNILLKVSDGYGFSEKKFKVKVKSYPRKKLRLTKIIPNPAGKDKESEEIEIFNHSSKRLNLKNFYLATGAVNKKFSSLTKHRIKKDLFIDPGESIIIKNKSKLCAFSLLNKGGRVSLLYPDGKTVDKLEYLKEKIFDDEYFKKEAGGWVWVREIDFDDSVDVSDDTKEPSVNSSAQFFIEGAFYNEKELLCENLTKVRIDNWKSAQSSVIKTLFRIYLRSEELQFSGKHLYEND